MLNSAEFTTRLATVCPKAPGDAQVYVDDVQGYVMWGVLALIAVAVIVGIGAVVAGRVFGMVHASKTGIISVVVVFFAAIAYMIAPSIISGVTGSGCV